jgi:putative endonuclease
MKGKKNIDNWHLYIVECSDSTLYTGITNDLTKRLHAHNNLTTGAKYTSMRRPVKMVYSEECGDRVTAMKRELIVKKMSRKAKLNLIKI